MNYRCIEAPEEPEFARARGAIFEELWVRSQRLVFVLREHRPHVLQEISKAGLGFS